MNGAQGRTLDARRAGEGLTLADSMSRRPSAEMVALEDQVAAVLRSATEPMDASTIGAQIRILLVHGCVCRLGRELPDVQRRGLLVVEHLVGARAVGGRPIQTDLVSVAPQSAMWAAVLRRMHRAGVVARRRVGYRAVWSWNGRSVDMAVFE